MEYLEIAGAKEHNLKNIHVVLPRGKFIVVTGVSGSGKSSLVFDTIYAEAQRRYLETFSTYARQFIGKLKRPEVEYIEGISPAVAIAQKTITRNPRSTVGTLTEIYDLLRLLYAKIAVPHSQDGRPLKAYSLEEILHEVLQRFEGEKVAILTPVVIGRKGIYRQLLYEALKKGFSKAYIDGQFVSLEPIPQLSRYQIHDIFIVIDTLEVSQKRRTRLLESLKTALDYKKKNTLVVLWQERTNQLHWFNTAWVDPTTGKGIEPPQPATFSFNSTYGRCPRCKGLGEFFGFVAESLIASPQKPLLKGALAFYKEPTLLTLKQFLEEHYIPLFTDAKIAPDTPFEALPLSIKEAILSDDGSPWSLASVLSEFFDAYEWSWEGEVLAQYSEWIRCTLCKGYRLKPESLLFKIAGKHIGELATMPLQQLDQWLKVLPERLSTRERQIAQELLKEIRRRLNFLLQVGLHYLHLNRASNTLSGGEAQRIRLATQIGSQLTEVLYVLDEPSIGLHASDNEKLLNALKVLRDMGNTIIVVEHDLETMLAADYLLDIGPGAGKEGGEVVDTGTPKEVAQRKKGITGAYLSGALSIEIPKKRREPNWNEVLVLRGAKGHNLKNITVRFPLGLLICITGVSGSGKSTLIHHTLYPALRQMVDRERGYHPLPFDSIEGIDKIKKVIQITQQPIGRTPRSNPATYTRVFDRIRRFYAQLPEAQIRGYAPGRFSFNVKGGRCEHCKGSGVQVIEMRFLPDVYVRCEYCRGKRYNRETLEVRYKGKSISDVLNMTIDEACVFFEKHPAIHRILTTLQQVGLGYLQLGQPAPTLSGGEAQRVKIAAELAKKTYQHTLYILDEPTTGLHFHDIKILLDVLNALVDKGNTVIVIEHNMDVIKMADWVIDLGPGAGDEGGYIVAEGPPEAIAQNPQSLTGKYLQKVLYHKVYEDLHQARG